MKMNEPLKEYSLWEREKASSLAFHEAGSSATGARGVTCSRSHGILRGFNAAEESVLGHRSGEDQEERESMPYVKEAGPSLQTG